MSTCILNCVVDKWASGLIGIPKAQGFDVANHWPLDTFVSGFSGFFFFFGEQPGDLHITKTRTLRHARS